MYTQFVEQIDGDCNEEQGKGVSRRGDNSRKDQNSYEDMLPIAHQDLSIKYSHPRQNPCHKRQFEEQAHE